MSYKESGGNNEMTLLTVGRNRLICVKGKSNHHLRSNTDTILGFPRKTLKTLSDRAFCEAALSLWNKFPRNVREVKNFETFKSIISSNHVIFT